MWTTDVLITKSVSVTEKHNYMNVNNCSMPSNQGHNAPNIT